MFESLKKDRYLRWFLITLITVFIVKSILASVFPLTGDEAYYVIWGKFFQWGYYDHTPFIGWLLWPFVHLSTANFIVRLPTLLVTTAIGIGLYGFLRSYDAEKASLIAILYLISPINLCGVLITTDIPLILFSFFSGLFLVLAVREQDHLGYYLLSGLCLGLAFFSKYFAVLLALAYLFYFLFSEKSKKRTLGFVLLFLAVLPFGLENLYWNYSHDWANILFNVFNRNRGITFEWHTVALYLLVVFYIATPPIFYYCCKHWKKLFRSSALFEFNVLIVSVFVPLVFFLGLSTMKSIGLHWPLSFVPFLYALLLIYLSRIELVRCIRFMFGFSFVHLVLISVVLLFPIQILQALHLKGPRYADWIFALKHREISRVLHQENMQFVLSSNSYAKADLMYIDSGKYSPSFGVGTAHGREGDFLTNFAAMQGKSFLILLNRRPDLSDYLPYFHVTRVQPWRFDGAVFYLVMGYHFNYLAYRHGVLKAINQRYWTVPSFLPHTKSFFFKKYWSAALPH
ncbi:MAG: glycosyltransferase family 39 protein [Pseudomonadota bacterium]